MRAIILAGVMGLLGVATPALACSGPFPTPAEEAASDDRRLLSATVMYRAEIADLGRDDSGGQTMSLRRMEIIWGEGAPDVVRINHSYIAACPLGNLWTVGEEGLRYGLRVTVLGDATFANDDGIPAMFVLVDGDPASQRLLQRFRELKPTQ